MSEESLEHYERLLVRLQQELNEQKESQPTVKFVRVNTQSEIISLEEQIEETEYKIFSKKYPRLENYCFYIKILPNLLVCFLLIVLILWGGILFQRYFENHNPRIFLNLFCVFITTTILAVASTYFRNAWRKQTKYLVLSVASESSAFLDAIGNKVSLIIQNENEL